MDLETWKGDGIDVGTAGRVARGKNDFPAVASTLKHLYIAAFLSCRLFSLPLFPRRPTTVGLQQQVYDSV